MLKPLSPAYPRVRITQGAIAYSCTTVVQLRETVPSLSVRAASLEPNTAASIAIPRALGSALSTGSHEALIYFVPFQATVLCVVLGRQRHTHTHTALTHGHQRRKCPAFCSVEGGQPSGRAEGQARSIRRRSPHCEVNRCPVHLRAIVTQGSQTYSVDFCCIPKHRF